MDLSWLERRGEQASSLSQRCSWDEPTRGFFLNQMLARFEIDDGCLR